MLTTSLKSIARNAGVTVAAANAAARDLGIATYEAHRRCWTIPSRDAAAFIDHLAGA